ncbi:hypothetical protein [Eupransor demetentiae]|uniref:DUF3278 domain-containing protein n=1 Tax=Eupransor demetentiae TaxID=3109584 RepID=A0ABM9N2V2_9LACO|nr:hypothetical protein R54876_GBNLAHCA_00022 [Lactobacillaceae bacterium LMG 33000]
MNTFKYLFGTIPSSITVNEYRKIYCHRIIFSITSAYLFMFISALIAPVTAKSEYTFTGKLIFLASMFVFFALLTVFYCVRMYKLSDKEVLEKKINATDERRVQNEMKAYRVSVITMSYVSTLFWAYYMFEGPEHLANIFWWFLMGNVWLSIITRTLLNKYN